MCWTTLNYTFLFVSTLKTNGMFVTYSILFWEAACTYPRGWGGGRYSRFQVAGMIEGFFWVGKFWKVFFRWLDLRRDFFGYSKQSEDFVIVPTYSWHIVLQIHFYGFINSAWDFLGVKFWSRDFFRFFWVLIFAPIQSSMSLDIQGIPPRWGGQIIN